MNEVPEPESEAHKIEVWKTLQEAEWRAQDRKLQEKLAAAPWYKNALVVGIMVTAITIVGNLVVSLINHSNTLVTERLKAEGERVLQALEAEDPDQAATNLQLLRDARLITGELEENIGDYLSNRVPGQGAVIGVSRLPDTTTRTWQRFDPPIVFSAQTAFTSGRPDGDSFRIIVSTENISLLNALRVRVSSNNSVQLRLAGVDAPELNGSCGTIEFMRHASDASVATEALLDYFDGEDGRDILVYMIGVGPFGRPIAYVVDPGRLSSADTGERSYFDDSVNATLLREGHALPHVFSDTPPMIAHAARRLATEAVEARRGMTANVETEFDFRDAEAAVMPPWLFRRTCRALDAGGVDAFEAELLSMLEQTSIEIDGVLQSALSVVEIDGSRIILNADPLNISFSTE